MRALVDFGEEFARAFEGRDEGGVGGDVDCSGGGGGGCGVGGGDGWVREGAFVDAEVWGVREGSVAAWKWYEFEGGRGGDGMDGFTAW